MAHRGDECVPCAGGSYGEGDGVCRLCAPGLRGVHVRHVAGVANATANYAFFLPPMRNGNDVRENDILLIFTGKEGSLSQSEVFALPVRGLAATTIAAATIRRGGGGG